jgi:hypothetical protein
MATMASVVGVRRKTSPPRKVASAAGNGDGGWFSTSCLCRVRVAWVVHRTSVPGHAESADCFGNPPGFRKASVVRKQLYAPSGVESSHSRFGGCGGQDSLRCVGGRPQLDGLVSLRRLQTVFGLRSSDASAAGSQRPTRYCASAQCPEFRSQTRDRCQLDERVSGGPATLVEWSSFGNLTKRVSESPWEAC